MLEQERLGIAIPSGELKGDVLHFLHQIGMEFDTPSRNLVIPVHNMPVDLFIVRASMIPQEIDVNTRVKVGITGSDLIWNYNSRTIDNLGEELPVAQLNSEAKKWALYIGVESSFANKIREKTNREPRVEDIQNMPLRDPLWYPLKHGIATEYKHVARQYLLLHNVDTNRVGLTFLTNEMGYPIEDAVPGGSEVLIKIRYNCIGVITVISSGKSAWQNDIEVLDIFHQGTIRMIENDNGLLTSHDRMILDDIRDKIAIAKGRTNPGY